MLLVDENPCVCVCLLCLRSCLYSDCLLQTMPADAFKQLVNELADIAISVAVCVCMCVCVCVCVWVIVCVCMYECVCVQWTLFCPD